MKIINYGMETDYKEQDRNLQIFNFYNMAWMCEGNERRRYLNVYKELCDGLEVCSDYDGDCMYDYDELMAKPFLSKDVVYEMARNKLITKDKNSKTYPLISLPADDGNFKSALKDATLEDIVNACSILEMYPEGNKSRLNACSRKFTQLLKKIG